MGMTDKRFMAMLYDELENWERVKESAEKENAVETAAMAQKQIEKVKMKLEA